jgi:hypothetical protein
MPGIWHAAAPLCSTLQTEQIDAETPENLPLPQTPRQDNALNRWLVEIDY